MPLCHPYTPRLVHRKLPPMTSVGCSSGQHGTRGCGNAHRHKKQHPPQPIRHLHQTFLILMTQSSPVQDTIQIHFVKECNTIRHRKPLTYGTAAFLVSCVGIPQQTCSSQAIDHLHQLPQNCGNGWSLLRDVHAAPQTQLHHPLTVATLPLPG